MSPQSRAAAAPAFAPGEYSPEERTTLLQLARRAIDTTLDGEPLAVEPPSVHLSELRGAFTTLRIEGKLRGCVGYIAATLPLYQTIVDTAIAAAFRDDRFEPVTRPEAPRIQVEISVLSSLRLIDPADVEVGKHGLLVSMGPWRGLLLPQVPIEWNWDRETFISQTCRKAGLRPDAWKQGATLEAFTAEVFGEPAS